MKSDVHIVSSDGMATQLAFPIALMATYGITATVHAAGAAFLADAPDANWLTLERRCVPLLAILAKAWSPDLLGGLGNVVDAAALRETLAAVGLTTSPRHVQGSIEGYVWNGVFRAAAVVGTPVDGAAGRATAQRACSALGVIRAYVRIDIDCTGAIVDVSPIPGDPAMIACARLAGFCPIWTAWCIATGEEPLTPLLTGNSVREVTLS
jgi:uncharacterized membrane protein YedE/YeeE